MTPVIDQIYQHRYGGLYIVDSVATHTTTKERLVVYTHLYPFESETYVRPLDEWTEDRFRLISGYDYVELSRKDKEQFKIEIGLARGKSNG
jgi:hypothetical protein